MQQSAPVLLGITATLGILLGIAGCSPATAPAAVVSAAPLATSIPLPDIGPSPAPSEISADEIEALRLSQQDQAWEQVLTRFPLATRPDVPFAGYLGEDEVLGGLIACYSSAAITIDIGVDPDGNPGGIMTSDLSEAESVTEFVCRQEHRSEPRALINTAQLGWMYDYLTEFYVPCLEANGIDNPPAPSRSDFIANWPNQNWFPSPGISPMGSDADEAIMHACPPPK